MCVKIWSHMSACATLPFVLAHPCLHLFNAPFTEWQGVGGGCGCLQLQPAALLASPLQLVTPYPPTWLRSKSGVKKWVDWFQD